MLSATRRAAPHRAAPRYGDRLQQDQLAEADDVAHASASSQKRASSSAYSGRASSRLSEGAHSRDDHDDSLNSARLTARFTPASASRSAAADDDLHGAAATDDERLDLLRQLAIACYNVAVELEALSYTSRAIAAYERACRLGARAFGHGSSIAVSFDAAYAAAVDAHCQAGALSQDDHLAQQWARRSAEPPWAEAFDPTSSELEPGGSSWVDGLGSEARESPVDMLSLHEMQSASHSGTRGSATLRAMTPYEPLRDGLRETETDAVDSADTCTLNAHSAVAHDLADRRVYEPRAELRESTAPVHSRLRPSDMRRAPASRHTRPRPLSARPALQKIAEEDRSPKGKEGHGDQRRRVRPLSATLVEGASVRLHARGLAIADDSDCALSSPADFARSLPKLRDPPPHSAATASAAAIPTAPPAAPPSASDTSTVLDTEIVASKGRGTPRERLDQSRKMDERMRTAATAVQALVSQASASAPAHAAPSSMVTHRRRAPPWAHAPRSTRVLAEVQLPNGQRYRLWSVVCSRARLMRPRTPPASCSSACMAAA